MTLNETILALLSREKLPISSHFISDYLNNQTEIRRDTGQEFSATQIQGHINNFPSLFHNLNGWITSTGNEKWRNFISSYTYIANILRGPYGITDVQFIASVLFFYKRILDLSTINPYPLFIHPDHSKIPWGQHDRNSDKDWLSLLPTLENEGNFPMPIFTEAHYILKRVSEKTLSETLSALRATSTLEFSDVEFSMAFEYVIDLNIDDSRKRTALIRTPHPIIELMSRLLNPRKGTVYDPVCGVGGLLTKVIHDSPAEVKVKGTEINYNIAQLAYINLFIRTHTFPNIKIENCYSELDSHESYDYIIADIPLETIASPDKFSELSKMFGISLSRDGRGLGAILLFVIAKLGRKGKAVLTVPENFLSSTGSDEKIRRFLIEEDIIECIISLPIHPQKQYISGKTSIIILNKSKPSYLLNKIKFIDATEVKLGSRPIGFDIENVVKEYKRKNSDNRNIQIVDNDSVKISDTLQVTYFTEKFHETHDLFRDGRAELLGNLVNIQRGTDLKNKDDANYLDGIPYIKMENLGKDILDMNLSSENLNNYITDESQYKTFTINNEVLLIARIGDHLKPTYFTPNRNISKIIIHPSILSLSKISGAKPFNFEYLYYQIYSLFIQKQVERKRRGAVMPFISIKALKSLVIPFMDVASQNEFIATQKNNIIAAERDRVNQRLKLIGIEEGEIKKESDIVSTLVHELRPKLVSINTLAKKIIRIIEKRKLLNFTEYDETNQVIDPFLAEILEPPENFNILDLGLNLEKNSKELNDMLRTVQNVMNFSLTSIDFFKSDILEFIHNYFKSRILSARDNYIVDVRGTNVELYFNQDSFRQILDQLTANANRHAFPTPLPNNKITFTVREDKERQIVIIEYANNGKPFLLSEKDFISFFQKSNDSIGSGIGGNFIYRIIKAHNGDLTIKEAPKRGFSMKIELPLKQENDE